MNQDIPRLWSAVENKIKSGKVGDEVSPELRINRSNISEVAGLNPVLPEKIRIEIFFGLALGHECRGAHGLADINKKLCCLCFHTQLGEENQSCFNLQAVQEVADNRQVQVDELFKARRKYLFNETEMVSEVRSVYIKTLQAFRVLAGPSALVADPDLIYLLPSQTLLPNRNGHPQGALIVLKTVSADPRRTLRKLKFVQDDEDVRKKGLVKETRVRAKIWLIGRYNHVEHKPPFFVITLPLKRGGLSV